MTLDDATIYSIRAVAAAAKPARKELQRLAKLCGIKANQKNTVILEELEKLDGETHIKNWRPQVLLLCKPGVQSQTVAHPKLLSLLKQLKGARGLCILGSIVPGRLAESAKLQTLMERALRRQRDENKLAGFTQAAPRPELAHLSPDLGPSPPLATTCARR